MDVTDETGSSASIGIAMTQSGWVPIRYPPALRHSNNSLILVKPVIELHPETAQLSAAGQGIRNLSSSSCEAAGNNCSVLPIA